MLDSIQCFKDTTKYFSDAIAYQNYHKLLVNILEQNWVTSLIIFITYNVITGRTNGFIQLKRKVSITESKRFLMPLNLKLLHPSHMKSKLIS